MADFKTTAVLRYDPWRGDMKNRTVGWCIADVDREITRYYREWLRRELHIHLAPPSWDAHVSVVRGERLRPDVQHLWKKYDGMKVDVIYPSPGEFYNVNSKLTDRAAVESGQFFIVNVDAPKLLDIRRELRLPTNWHLHLTFGRIYEYEARKPKREWRRYVYTQGRKDCRDGRCLR
jgi:hypothetical protein